VGIGFTMVLDNYIYKGLGYIWLIFTWTVWQKPPITDPATAIHKITEKYHAKNWNQTFPPLKPIWLLNFSSGQNKQTNKQTNNKKKLVSGLALIKDCTLLHLPTSAPLRAFPNGQGLISIIFPLTLSNWTQPWNPRLVPAALTSQYTLGAPPT